MSSFDNKRRDLKRPFRKKSLQTKVSVVDESVDSTPLPPSSYTTSTHLATTPIRRGIDPHIYEKTVRPAVESLDFARPLDLSRYPWHLVPKGDSANVISRISWDFSVGANNVADDEYADILVLNLQDATGSAIPGPAAITGNGGPTPSPATTSIRTATGTTTVGNANPDFPLDGGQSTVGVTGTIRKAGPNEIYRIGSFGHSEIVAATNFSTPPTISATDPIRYQIWIDGDLFMEWQNFQWSPVTPLDTQWHFSQPLTVTEQIVFRIINQTGQTANIGDIEVCFNGWSEQFSGYTDVSYQQLQE